LAMLRRNGMDADVFFFRNPTGFFSQIFWMFLSPFNINSYFRFKGILRREKPSIVHLHNWHFVASPSVVWAAARLGIPVVVTIHNYRLICPTATLFHRGKLYLESLHPRGLMNAVVNRVYKDSLLATLLLAITLKMNRTIGTWRNVHGVIFLNEFMRDIHHKSLADIASVCDYVKPNFIEDIQLSGSVDVGDREGFLFVGRLSEEKGVEVLLNAFSKSGRPLKIIGDGPLRHLVEQYVSEFSNILFVGYQEKEYILQQMALSKWLVFPSIWYEGMPITILEAFMTGTPVIASNIGSLPSIVIPDENGFLFPPGSVDGLVTALEETANLSLDTYSRYCNLCLISFKQKFTEKSNFNMLRNIYERIIYKGT